MQKATSESVRQCPNCKGVNIRRIARDPMGPEQPLIRSEYRCRDCHTNFKALSTSTHRRIIVFAAVLVVLLAAIIWSIVISMR